MAQPSCSKSYSALCQSLGNSMLLSFESVDGSLVMFSTSWIVSVPMCWNICSCICVESCACVCWIVNVMLLVSAVVTLRQWWRPLIWTWLLPRYKWLSYWWTSYQTSIAFSSDVKVCIPGFGLSPVQSNVASGDDSVMFCCCTLYHRLIVSWNIQWTGFLTLKHTNAKCVTGDKMAVAVLVTFTSSHKCENVMSSTLIYCQC